MSAKGKAPKSKGKRALRLVNTTRRVANSATSIAPSWPAPVSSSSGPRQSGPLPSPPNVRRDSSIRPRERGVADVQEAPTADHAEMPLNATRLRHELEIHQIELRVQDAELR